MKKQTQDRRRLVGSRIAELRKQRRWSQRELVEQLEPHGLEWLASTAAKTETGKRPLPVEELFALASVFGVEPSALLSGDQLTDKRIAENELAVARAGCRAAEKEHEKALGVAYAASLEVQDRKKWVKECEEAVEGNRLPRDPLREAVDELRRESATDAKPGSE